MAFGLYNAPATYQRFVDNLLLGLQGSEVFAFLDDIVIFGRNLAEHNNKMRKVFEKLTIARVALQPGKCDFLRKEVNNQPVQQPTNYCDLVIILVYRS